MAPKRWARESNWENLLSRSFWKVSSKLKFSEAQMRYWWYYKNHDFVDIKSRSQLCHPTDLYSCRRVLMTEMQSKALKICPTSFWINPHICFSSSVSRELLSDSLLQRLFNLKWNVEVNVFLFFGHLREDNWTDKFFMWNKNNLKSFSKGWCITLNSSILISPVNTHRYSNVSFVKLQVKLRTCLATMIKIKIISENIFFLNFSLWL